MNGLYPMMEMMTVIFMELVMVVLSSKPEIRISNSLPKDLFFVGSLFFMLKNILVEKFLN